MAVVFISPKSRQRMFFMIITVAFLMFMAFIFFGVFLSSPQGTAQVLVFNKPKVDINMQVFDSPQFKNLEAFPETEIQYSYAAVAKDNTQKTGFITAVSVDQATSILTNMGLSSITIREAQVGRENPFTPYYQLVIPTSTVSTGKTTTTKSAATGTTSVQNKVSGK